MANNDLTGHTLGQYTVTARLGRGGMADVYKAYHPKLEVYRALKVIRPEFVTASDFRERFQKEAQSVASLRHPNIVQIHDFGEQDDAYYMVMEFVEGQDLKRVVKSEGKIRPIKRCLQLIEQVADALHYAHSRGLIHRDIKPENIMINEDGLPILMDFGIAKLLTANTQLTQTGMGIGTPAYMAPEQAQALPEIGPPADIYSLSVVLYEMLTGQVPFSADTPMAVMLKAINDPTPMPRQFSNDISEDLQQVLLKGMAKDPENRYDTARQFQRSLREVMDNERGSDEPMPTAVMDAGAGERQEAAQEGKSTGKTRASEKATKVRAQERSGSRRPGLVAALVVLALVVVGGAGAGVYFLLEPDRFARVADAPDGGAEPEASSSEGDGEPDVKDPAAGSRVASADTETGDDVERSGLDSADEPAQEEGAPDEPRIASADAESGTADSGPADGPPQAGEPASGGRNAMMEAESVEETGQPRPDTADESGPAEVATDADSMTDGGARTAAVDPEGSSDEVAGQPGKTEAPSPETPAASKEPAALDGGFIAFGDYVQEQIPERGRGVAYEFEAGAGQSVFFDHVDTRRTARRVEFRLMAPDGDTSVFETRGDHGPVTLDQTGIYTLVANPRDDRVDGYEFIIWNVDPLEVDGGTLRPGLEIEGKTSVPGQRVTYTFQANNGQTIQFEHVESTEPTDFTLTAPDGSRVFRTQGDHGPETLDQSGTYTLEADPREDRVSKFKFVVRPVAAG
jgi:tRNA A-37 threonylcarbamoyl transferase component Bud32/plastocyanin